MEHGHHHKDHGREAAHVEINQALRQKLDSAKLTNESKVNNVLRLLTLLGHHQTQTGKFPEEDEWEYGEHKEAEWAHEWPCGPHQSPINIDPHAIINASDILKNRWYFPLNINYSPHTAKGEFNPRTFIVRGNFGSLLVNSLFEENPRIFDIAQFHFHASSEHLLYGQRYDLELHVVHKERSNPSNLLVFGFFFRNDGRANPFLENVIRSEAEPTSIDMNLMIPKMKCLYFYEGSLTTPPLFEPVLWFLNPHLNSINSEQLEFFTRHWSGNHSFAGGKGNYREAQPLNDRSIIHFE
ncbi:unnamed protein product [Blepharisma stoltei]|uniref:Carbonic anhydrase n=1 Tax=Blepharisma stoltei TaxID=1481888 RepID=A0AAU9I4Z8_9CILI|nr:unnamed protein product [Blepharisma stoltei]